MVNGLTPQVVSMAGRLTTEGYEGYEYIRDAAAWRAIAPEDQEEIRERPHDRRAVSFGPTAWRHHQWRARYGGTRPTGATETTSTEWFGGRRAVSFGPTAYRCGEGSINENPWIGLSGSPVEQLLDAKTS